MTHHSFRLRLLAVLTLTINLAVSFPAAAQDDAEEAREAKIIERFVTVLEKNPRRGTALDKVYGFHVERGSLDGFVKTYREKATAAKGTGASPVWMIVGLVESLRGQDAAAADAFGKAEELDRTNYLASYYLGQSLVLVGQPDKAAEALERAIERKPAQADQLDVFQALGRVYQRAQKNEKALEVWNRLEKQFPNDIRVQEQIATTLLEENEFAAALPRFENLARNTKDKYRQSLFQVEAAEIKVRLGKTDEAIKEFEKLLGQLNPDNWLFREVRRRIENVYLRTDDQAGLISYYDGWTKKNPEDLEAISRLARLLAGLGRGPEAQAWLEKGLKVAPSRKELRNALIAQLIYEQKFPEAIVQYELLDKYEPNNPDTLRDWGRLILKDSKRDEATRKKDATAVWNRLTLAKPKDPLIASQVAELFRNAEMVDEALALYRKSIELAPEAAQYKEYLGEFFHSLQRKDEALATWRQIADGKNRTAANVARLAEVLTGFGYLAEAVETNAEACKLDPKDINLQIKQADLLSQADRHDEALQQLTVVQKLAANDEEREAWLQRELKELQTLEKLKERTAQLQKELDDSPMPTTEKQKSALSEKWFWIARAYEAERQLKEAAAAITKASDLSPQSIPVLMSSARILELQQNLLGAVEINTRLAAIDRRYRTEYLKKVSQLEVQLGRRDKAIQAGRDLLASAPGNPELYEFFSQLCFQLGEGEEGLQALRRSVRVNPTEPKGLLLLASALSEQFRTGEAIELYWRAFEKAASLEDRLGVIPKLTELYLQTNQLDRLLERLERQRREPNQQREMTICLAQAYQSAGDDGNARQELEKLLTEDTRDTQLLQQLVKLCEQDNDLEAAIRFQQQMNKAAPGKEGTMRLAQLLMKSGERDEATKLLLQVSIEEKDPEQLLKSIDSLLTQKNYEQVLGITDRLVRDQSKNWELIYRHGVALTSTKPEEAAKQFQAILALSFSDDEQTLAVKNAAKKPQGRMRSPAVTFREMHPLIQRAQYSWNIRRAVGIDREDYYYSGGGYSQQQPFWSPMDFGMCRMACLGWLQVLAKNGGKEDEFVKRWAMPEKMTDRRAVIDSYYLATLRSETKDQYEILKQLSMQPDADLAIKSLYLSHLSGRGGNQVRSVVNEETGESELQLEPLSKEEMDHVLDCFKSVDDGTAMFNYGQSFVEMVTAEMKRAGRTEEAVKMQQAAIDEAKSPLQIASVLSGAIQRGDYDLTIKLLDRLAEFKQEPVTGQINYNNYGQYIASPQYQSQILAQLMAKRAQKKELKDVVALWDRFLPLAISRHESDKATPVTVRRRNAANSMSGSPQYYYIWRGNRQTGEQVDFPVPNEFYDQATLQMLRQMFVSFKDDDSVKDVLDHFQKKSRDEKASSTQTLFWKLGLGYLHWWNDDKDDALAALTEVAGMIPDNEQMTFELAGLHERKGDPEQALALIESLPTADQQTMQKREISALRLSVNTGNIDRARTAAERLFGLRLDTNLQIQLARQMHQLAMHEQAEAVLARAGRQAGNKTDVLMNLMQQYQSQGKNDIATQIAHQLLRRSSGSGTQNAMGGMIRSGRDASGARQQALQVLKRSGKLPEMIKKVEEQLTHSPKSQKLLETLMEYYTANGDEKKVAELSARYAETKGDDPQFRYQLAMQLIRDGKPKESIEHFKAALKKEPRLLRNSYWEVQNAFESADKLEDLANLYEEIDLKTFRQSPYELTNLISNMSRRDKTKDRSISLFKKAWVELPDQRAQLLSNLNSDVFWKMPEIYDYARQGIIPTESSLRNVGEWAGFGNIQSWGNDGKITTLLNRFLTIAAQTKRLDELATEIEQAQGKLKTWKAGEPLLALVNLRRGRIDEAKATFEKLLTTVKRAQDAGYYTHWEIAQELQAHEACVDLAIRYLEAAVKEPELMSGNEFPYTPAKPLVVLYKQRGRTDEARRVMLAAVKARPNGNYNDPQYESYRRVRNAISLGNEIRSLGFPVDAIRLYQSALSRQDDLANAARYGGDNMKRELQTGFQAAMAALNPDSLPDLLTAPADSTDDKSPKSIDLVLLLETRDLDTISMTSALGKLMAELVKKPELVPKVHKAFSEVLDRRPEDMSVLILAGQLSMSTNDQDKTKALLKQLLDTVDKTPLEAQPAKGGFTSSQHEAALQQTALWLLARDCLKKEPLRGEGTKLAERALLASRRNSDQGYTLAILREWGQIALENGDRKAAEEYWTELLDIVLPKPVVKPAKKDDAGASWRMPDPRGGEDVFPGRERIPGSDQYRLLSRWEQMIAPALAAQLAAPVATSRVAPAPSGARGNVVTLAQFEQAAQIAKLAAENGFIDLSLTAMSKALHSGPPIEAMQAPDASASGFPTITQPQSSDQSPVIIRVEQRLTGMELIWRRRHVEDERIYELLKAAVLPTSRPLEVFIYPRQLNISPNQTPQSIGLLLVQTAIRAKKTDDLKQALESRLQQPIGELPARIIQTQLALAERDTKTAQACLEALSSRLKQDSLQYSSELACHVAVPAMTLPDLPPAAVTLLERALEHFAQNMQQGRANPQEEPMRTFRFTLARFHFQNGDQAAGKKHLDEYLSFLVPLFRRYGGDYGQQRRKAELMKLAAEFARAGMSAESLDCLGQFADLTVSRNYAQDNFGRQGAMLFSGLSQLPAAQRYELLKTWTMPTADRKSVRVVAGLAPADRAPAGFDGLRGNMPRSGQDVELISTADLLMTAAKEAGKIDELRTEIQPHADQNLENARFLGLMTQIAQGEGARMAPALKEYLEERRKNLPNQGDNTKRPQLIDGDLALAAMRDPALVGLGRELAINFFLHSSRVQDHHLMALMRRDYNASVIGPEMSARLNHRPSETDLKHWTAASTATARTDAAGAIPMWWIAHEGLIGHICGPEQSHLYFKYPLTGSFELSADCWLSGWAESNTGYDGIAFAGLNNGGGTSIFSIGNRGDAVNLPDPPEVQDRYNRVTLRVEPNQIRYYVNGYLIHTVSDRPATSPWFFLHCDRIWQTCFRNLRITGNPVIPREVQLSQGSSLLGWCSSFYSESSLPQVVTTPPSPDSNPDYDWWANEGQILGRIQPSTGFGNLPVQQSRLYYDRPVLDGETLRYEFWHEPGLGGSMVHPALDRLAFLLDTDGVKLHWMTDGTGLDDAFGGLLPENILLDKTIQRGPVLLKDQAWNAVEISLKESSVTMSLNGSVVCERELEAENSRQFGFYHDKNATSVKARNVVLTGDWPQSLTPEITSSLTALAKERTPADRRLLRNVIEEKFQAYDLDALLLQTRSMSPQQRYESLKKWVLPNDDHEAVRLYGDTAPADPLEGMSIVVAPVSLTGKSPPAAQVSKRRRSGGDLIAPVLDLVSVARELGKLDELSSLVRDISPTSEQLRRSRQSLLVLTAIAGGDLKQAETLLKDLTPNRSPGLPDSLPVHDRWPELIVATEAARIPELRRSAVELFEVVLDSENRNGQGGWWDVKIRSLRQHARALHDREIELQPAMMTSPRGEWTQVTHTGARNRSLGLVPTWQFVGKAETLHLGGEGNDLMYFQSPLSGTFTVEAELSTFGWREARLMYAAQWAAAQYTHEAADIGNLYSNWTGPKFPTKLPPLGDWVRMKMEVTPEKVIYFANDRAIHEHTMNGPADPWLAIHCFGQYAGATRSVRILGKPEIPAEIALSKREDLAGWWAGTYNEPISGDAAAWKKNGDEISGPVLPGWERREALLQYHRPMLEDGEMTYEFFYVPQQTVVHPALGRLAMLLTPEGIKNHWLTDAQFDRGGLLPDNVSVEPESRRGPDALPLKINDWNQVSLAIKGDQLTLGLNGETVYSRPIEATNQRTFGLFRYAGDSEARVKNVIYKGNWPRTLPSLKEQEMSGNDLELATFGETELPARFAWNFQGKQPTNLMFTAEVPTNKRQPVQGGLQVSRQSNIDPISYGAGFQWPTVTMGGDFEVTLDFRDFQSTTKKSDHQVPRMEIILSLGGTFGQHSQTVALTHRRHSDGSMLQSAIVGNRPNPPTEDWQSSDHSTMATSGRIRIVRRDSTAYYLAAPLGSEEWQLLDRRPASAADVKDFIVGLRSEDPEGTASAVLTGFSVRATRLSFIPRFADDELPAQLAWNFQSPQPKGLQKWAAELPNKFESAPDGTRIIRPQDAKQSSKPVGFNWQGKLRGDFEVTLDFHDFDSNTDAADWQVPRIEIHIPIGEPADSASPTYTATVGHRRKLDGSLALLSGVSTRQPTGQQSWSTNDQSTDRNAGRLRIIRSGSIVHALAAPPGSSDFVLIASRPASDADIHSMSFTVRSESKNSTAAVTFTGMLIRAAELNSDSIAATNAPKPIPGPVAFAADALPATLSWNFQGPAPAFLKNWSAVKQNQVAPVPEGIRLTRSAKVPQSESVVGYELTNTLQGDFEVTLEYRDFTSTPVLTDWRVPRVDVSASISSAASSGKTFQTAGIAHRRNQNGDLKLLATQGQRGTDDKFTYKTVEAPTDRQAGRLRIVRQGTSLYYQAAPSGSDQWQTINRLAIDPGPVRSLSIGLRAEDLDASADVILTELSIRAKEVIKK